ncbi:hypothetical protein [Arthrobacter polaris]|uniref:hypothetical protein n=1 Tax=Arthrobacter polaris TaxID=2813727 RepID=UPI001F30E722|nr:hypothetical protein [Arthrobacter polaris]
MKLPNTSATPVSRLVFAVGALSAVGVPALSACGGDTKTTSTAAPTAADLAACGSTTITM